jgi:anti-sigma-K factor RskA
VCEACRVEVESLERLRRLVRSAATPGDPDWSSLWAAVERRITNEAPRPLRDSWWRPLWKPVWGHPRLASAAAALVLALLTVSLWTGTEEFGPSADVPVTVQDAATDSKGSVMVYSNRDPGMTVVWVLANDSAGGGD